MSADTPELPSEEELASMSRDELARLGMKLDGVELVEYPDPWPVKGTRAEKRAERLVALWFAIAGLAGLAFFGVFLFWPSSYEAPEPDHFSAYYLYTPLLGATLGLAVLGIGIGVLLYAKKFIPHEVAVQQRHDGGSAELDKATILAELADAGTRSTIGRRSLIKRSAGFGMTGLGLGAGVFAIGGLIHNPWSQTDSKDSLWHTGWMPERGERVYLRRLTKEPTEVVLVKPEDLDAGGMETVFPFHAPQTSSGEVDYDQLEAAVTGKAKLDREVLAEDFNRGDNPVMLIHLRSSDAAKVIKYPGQEDFNYGDFYAYTKICSHLGCPASLFEQRTNRILCPCHQSQFDALEYAKPIFGPATRKLAQLPIALDEKTGYLYARSDFIEAVGPAFWERRS